MHTSHTRKPACFMLVKAAQLLIDISLTALRCPALALKSLHKAGHSTFIDMASCYDNVIYVNVNWIELDACKANKLLFNGGSTYHSRTWFIAGKTKTPPLTWACKCTSTLRKNWLNQVNGSFTNIVYENCILYWMCSLDKQNWPSW